jgi:hypothetical protein
MSFKKCVVSAIILQEKFVALCRISKSNNVAGTLLYFKRKRDTTFRLLRIQNNLQAIGKEIRKHIFCLQIKF